MSESTSDKMRDSASLLQNEVRGDEFSNKTEILSARHVLAMLGFLGFANVYIMRVVLSMSILQMVNSTAIPRVSNSTVDVCPVDPSSTTPKDIPQDGEFVWDEYTQGIILSSFFWGYVVTQIPGGIIAEKYGAKWLFGIGVFVTAILTLVTPWAARCGVNWLIFVRVLEGLGEGVTFPAMHSLLAKWCPVYERSSIGSYIYAGSPFGTIVAMAFTGILSNFGGWPTVFYVFGISGIIWFVMWIYFVHESPGVHPRISHEERLYIESSVGCDGPNSRRSLEVPWYDILTSPAVWAICAAHTGQNWGFYTLLTELPTYMKNMMHFNINENALLSALPFLLMWLLGIMMSNIADFIRRNGIMSNTSIRKLFVTLGLFVPALSLMGSAYTGCNRPATVSLLTMATGFNGAMYAGYMMNHLDISPNFAGTIMGISNMLANFTGIAAPYVAGSLVSGKQTLGQWQIVFYTASFISIGANIIYLIFGQGEEQPWNQREGQRERKHVSTSEPRETRPLIGQ